VRPASGIPCALLIFEGDAINQDSGKSCRGNADARTTVIASEAKESRPCPRAKMWIASSLPPSRSCASADSCPA